MPAFVSNQIRCCPDPKGFPVDEHREKAKVTRVHVDLLLENGRLVIPKGGVITGCLGVTGGKVVGIFDSPAGVSARQKIDCKGFYVLPGLVEPHVHYGYRGNLAGHFFTETASAAIGGITTVIPFYRDIQRPTVAYDNLAEVKKLAEANSCIDFSLHLLLITRNQLAKVKEYVDESDITSFKFYMAYKGKDAKSIGLEGNETDDGFLFEAFSSLAQMPGVVACVHAENIEVILSLVEKYQGEGRQGLKTWSDCRPNFTEAESVHRAATFAEVAGCPLYVAHVTTKESLEDLRLFKSRHQKIYVETCPHYLTLTKDSPLGNVAKVNPPLRSEGDVEALWRGISSGLIDTVGSDHCPFLREDKEGTIWDAKTGFPGSATMLPVLLSEGVHKKRVSLEKVAELTSYNPGKIFNLFPRKGTIQVGSDADFCIVDLEMSKKVNHEMLLSSSDFSVYEGWTLKGWPVMTIVRGKTVMKDGKILGPQGHGRFIGANQA
jgi:dihydropyrimidinase